MASFLDLNSIGVDTKSRIENIVLKNVEYVKNYKIEKHDGVTDIVLEVFKHKRSHSIILPAVSAFEILHLYDENGRKGIIINVSYRISSPECYYLEYYDGDKYLDKYIDTIRNLFNIGRAINNLRVSIKKYKIEMTARDIEKQGANIIKTPVKY